MLKNWRGIGLVAAMVLCLTSWAYCDEEVTIKGVLQCNGMCIADAKPEDHVIVIVAVDGSPSIKAKVKKVMDEFYPEKGLDADAAQKLDAEFDKELKFFISPDSTAKMPADMPKLGKNHYCHSASPYVVTGTISEHDGKKWIKVSNYQQVGKYSKNLGYPEVMLAPDKPFVMPEGKPLEVKITDGQSLKFIKVPPGKLFMDEGMFMATRYIEQMPHLVTLTKSVYIAEIPVTQELWEAVMGSNSSKDKGALLPMESPSYDDLQEFCKKVSEKTGKQMRLPTGAEWEYISRSGTSNPGFPDKYRDQGIFKEDNKKVPQPVKSFKPNAWGFYDLFSCWWEMTNDGSSYPSGKPETDPKHPISNRGEAKNMHMLLGLSGENWTITEREFEQFSGYAPKKFRLAFEGE